MMRSPFAEKLIAWYQQHQRDLPWRQQTDGYAVWVSEIMLQQTRVETVKPYYQRWMTRFPTVEKLAQASQGEVLSMWEGLGYYSRARNLHKAAQTVVKEHGGELPDTAKALQDLPGIGRYTAGAIASIVFGRDEPAVDGNVKRVLARVFNVEEVVDSSAGERRIWQLAEENLPPGQASDYNQALMELGARVCTPRKPNCALCPIKEGCQAQALGIQGERPLRKPKRARPLHRLAAAVIREGENVLLRQRPEDGLLGGMWEFPNVRVDNGNEGKDHAASLEDAVRAQMGLRIRARQAVGAYQHEYTHFQVKLEAFNCELLGGNAHLRETQAARWVRLAELEQYPMGKLDRQISTKLSQENG